MVPYSNAAANPYKQQDIMTLSPGELTLRLLNGSIKDLNVFKQGVEKKDYALANTNSQKAQSIVIELMRSLDMRYEISKQLLPLYDFILDIICAFA